MNFSVGIMETLVKLMQVEILELITCSATSTGMLVKRALTSNKRFLIFLMKAVLSFAKDKVLAQ